MIEFAAVGSSAVAFAACVAERQRGKLLVPTAMVLMLIAMIVVVVLPDAHGLATGFGLGLCVLAPVIARQQIEEATEGASVVRSESMLLMGVMLLLHASGNASDVGHDAHVHGGSASMIVGALVIALTSILLAISLDPRYRPDVRVGIELWAGVLSCGVMLLHA